MAEAKEKAEKADWDGTSINSEARHKKAEDRMAAKIATEVLSNNPKLRGVHSKESIKKILEKEAIRQMQQEGSYPAPNIVRINEK
jgi:beta-phosphoglucomutase-like phosphatase (HAD superfamily)